MVHQSLISKAGICSLVAAIGPAPAGASIAEDVGLLGLFRVSDPAAYSQALMEIESSTAAFGCAIRRHGKLSGTQGPLALPDVNRFLLLKCEAPLLAGRAGRAALQPLAGRTSDFVLLEGNARWSADDLGSAVNERAYVIKLSHFNNRAPDARDDTLASVGHDVAARPHAYQNAAVIAVDRAWGIPTPDDVTVLFYRSAADGSAFREQNPDIMKRIGEFNATHVDDFVYASGAAER